MSEESATLLIVDDEEMVLTSLNAFLMLETDYNVETFTSANEAVAFAQNNHFDLVISDYLMPEMDGIEATRRVKNISPRSQIVILTSHHDDSHIFPAIRAGALSYVLKDIKMEELVATIRRAAVGEATLHPRIASRVIQEVRGDRVDDFNPFTELTEREMDTLQLIAQGMSNAEIAERLVISENTVKGYVSNVWPRLYVGGDRVVLCLHRWAGVVEFEYGLGGAVTAVCRRRAHGFNKLYFAISYCQIQRH